MKPHQMDGRVEVFPDQGVMLHIPVQEKGHQPGSRLFRENWENYKLDEVLLGDIAGAEVADPIDRHNPDILDCAEKILEKVYF